MIKAKFGFVCPIRWAARQVLSDGKSFGNHADLPLLLMSGSGWRMPQPEQSVSLEALATAKTLAACINLFRELLKPMDIDTFACGETDVSNRARSVFHVIDWPDDWRKFYFGSGLVERDPVVLGLEVFGGPFTWQDMRRNRSLAHVGTEGLDRVAAAGWHDGLVVPIRRSKSRYALISMVARTALISARQRSLLVPAAICFHNRVRELFDVRDFPVPPAGLTIREIECIAEVAFGLSEEKIAAKIGIGSATVREHLDRARTKLDAKNRAELVALALSLGIIRG
jgi:LuxR family transcriptional regulator, quorum-sensing system regulator BjaR1